MTFRKRSMKMDSEIARRSFEANSSILESKTAQLLQYRFELAMLALRRKEAIAVGKDHVLPYPMGLEARHVSQPGGPRLKGSNLTSTLFPFRQALRRIPNPSLPR